LTKLEKKPHDMKRKVVLNASLALVFICLYLRVTAQEDQRSRETFNEGWKFIKFQNASDEASSVQREPENLQLPSADDSKWSAVDLPHDWAIEGPFNDSLENNTGLLPWKAIGWYRKHFRIDDKEAGKRFYIDIDGAMANSKVWLNGKYVGGWPYGYTSYRLDLTPFINTAGENIIAIRLDTKNWDSRWYPGAGLYRNVWLVKTSDLHIAHNGVFCTTPEITGERGMLSVSAEVENNRNIPASSTIKAVVYKLDDKFIPGKSPVAESKEVSADIPAGSRHAFRLDIPVKNPALWNVHKPELYMVKVTVNDGDRATDTYSENFGFRTAVFTPRDGLYVNDERVQIRGVCNHHDLGALGAAFNRRAAERQLEILREMGCNAIRTSHNPPAPELADLCDKMGFMMQVEAFDTWRIGKKPNDYSKQFDAWHEEDLKMMVRNFRNHPSVIMWSIGNEVPDQANPYIATSLNSIVKSEDNTRPVTSGCNDPEAGTNGFEMTVDVFGINYHIGDYKRFFDLPANAMKPFHSSESASTISSRGEYFFPVVPNDLYNNLPGKGIFQITSYDVAYPSWATTPDQQFEADDRFPAVAGEFVWTGFDYLGEPTPYSADMTELNTKMWGYKEVKKMLDFYGVKDIPSRSSYFGIIDLAGFPKDRFYLYRSRWRPDEPMAHILPHWNWPERKGQVTPVHVYTSGDEAELFLNGKSLGRKQKGQYEYRLKWDDVVYQPGELRVVAYKDGNKWAEDVVRTTGRATAISLSADRKTIKADGNDLVFVTVKIEDPNKQTVPRSNNLINFTVSGPGRIVATDNGDATDHTPFSSKSRKAFNGMCLVIVKADKNASGQLTVKAMSKGIKGAETTIGVAE
jgi:beta-galactosidase